MGLEQEAGFLIDSTSVVKNTRFQEGNPLEDGCDGPTSCVVGTIPSGDKALTVTGKVIEEKMPVLNVDGFCGEVLDEKTEQALEDCRTQFSAGDIYRFNVIGDYMGRDSAINNIMPDGETAGPFEVSYPLHECSSVQGYQCTNIAGGEVGIWEVANAISKNSHDIKAPNYQESIGQGATVAAFLTILAVVTVRMRNFAKRSAENVGAIVGSGQEMVASAGNKVRSAGEGIKSGAKSLLKKKK